MRERVVGLGGEFAAGRDNGGRFVVRARLPLGGRG
jgi:signal transduction histidine kinase